MKGWATPRQKFLTPAGFTTQAVKWFEICRSGEKSLTPLIFSFFHCPASKIYGYIHTQTHTHIPPANPSRLRTDASEKRSKYCGYEEDVQDHDSDPTFCQLHIKSPDSTLPPMSSAREDSSCVFFLSNTAHQESGKSPLTPFFSDKFVFFYKRIFLF